MVDAVIDVVVDAVIDAVVDAVDGFLFTEAKSVKFSEEVEVKTVEPMPEVLEIDEVSRHTSSSKFIGFSCV